MTEPETPEVAETTKPSFVQRHIGGLFVGGMFTMTAVNMAASVIQYKTSKNNLAIAALKFGNKAIEEK